jgi:hypothetical protein
MFNFLKKGNKEKEKELETLEDLPWGLPVKRKMTKKEEAAALEEQLMVERKNTERRDMYRLPGKERIFNDLQGRRLALRIEDNTGPKAVSNRPAFFVVIFWGTRELAHLKAELQDRSIRMVECHTEGGYEGWGLPTELLRELELLARTKETKELYATIPADQQDWDNLLFTQLGYQPQGADLVKLL